MATRNGIGVRAPAGWIRLIGRRYREAFAGLPRPVWLLGVATLINRSGTMVLPFLALYLTEERGFTAAGAGRILAVYGLGGLAGAYLGGWLCDRVEPRRVMEASLLLTGAGFLLVGHLESRAAIAGTIALLSLVAEAFRPADAAALAAASGPAERAQAFALNRLAINMGMSLGPAVGGFLALRSYRWLFAVDGATCMLAAVFLYLAFRRAAPALDQASPAAPAAAGVPAGRSPWRDGPFLLLLALMTLLGTVFFQSVGTYPLTLRDSYGQSEAGIGLLLAINTVLIVLFEMVLVHAIRGVDPLRVLAVGGFFFCAGFGLLPLGSTFAFAAFTVVVWTLGEMLALPVASAVVAARAEGGSRGSYMGLYVISFQAAFVLAPLIGTWVYQHLGPDVLWYSCGLVGLPLLAGFWLLARSWRPRAPAG